MGDPLSFVQGGCRIRNQRFSDICGTLACVVYKMDDPTVRYLLSAAHVMNPGGYGKRDDVIEAELSSGWTPVAVLENWTPLRDVTGVHYTADAAIARIFRPEIVRAGVRDIGDIRDVGLGAFADKLLQAYGAKSGRVVESVVYDTHQQAPVFYEDWSSAGAFALPFDDLILYGLPIGNQPAMQPGDSGALVLDNNRLAIGLHIARTDDDHPTLASVCTPIETVLSKLGVALELGQTQDLQQGLTPAGAAPVTPTVTPSPASASGKPSALMLDPDEISERSRVRFGVSVMRQLQSHTLYGGCQWQLTPQGLVVDGRLERSGGALVTVPRVWQAYRYEISNAAAKFGVPIELIIATICTESSGNASAKRREPDGRISVGLMQTLLGTAQQMLPHEQIDESTLLDPDQSIRAGTAYIANQRYRTNLDPPLVACAYNAGSLRENKGVANRWRMAQYPLGTSAHADRFVQWFNDCFACFEDPAYAVDDAGTPSFWGLFRR